MDNTSKTLTFINILLIILLSLFWHKCHKILLDSDQWLQNHQELLSDDNPSRSNTKILQYGSSVWCQGTNNTDRTCHFRYLCFAPALDSFFIFHGPNSVISGVPANRFSPALLDLSSVPNHNTQYFHYQDMPVSGLFHFHEVIMYNGSYFMFNRFNPSNLMHVFHDDLLPVFHTLLLRGFLNLDDLKSSARLVFLEGWKEGEYFDMYGWLSRGRPLLMEDFKMQSPHNSLICFQDAFLGLSKETTWYQYGFEIPQGDLPNAKVTAQEIRIFTKYFMRSLKAHNVTAKLDQYQDNKEPDQSQTQFVRVETRSQVQHQACLFVRESNRLILNEAGVLSTIAQVSGLTTVKISLDELFDTIFSNLEDELDSGSEKSNSNPYMDNSHLNKDDINPDLERDLNRYNKGLEEFLSEIRRCHVVVGMHGSLLALIMFLNPGSVVVELFPYAINPDHYTPYKTLSNLPGMQIMYKSWSNTKVANSKTHPDSAPDQGGIMHLSIDEQTRIINSKEVPRHLCCSDPEWLFRVYQDSIVDIPSFRAILSSALNERDIVFDTKMQNSGAKEIDVLYEIKATPSFVENASCDRVHTDEGVFGIKLSWKPPMNLNFFKSADKKYEVWILELGKEDYKAYVLEITEHVFRDGLDERRNYRVWIRCLVDDKVGQFVLINSC